LWWFVGFGGSIDAAAILDFVDSGHDLIVAADNNASDLIREIATECGVDFDEVIIVQFFCRWTF
jgi:oligosaccharyltransferase complex subunit beta